MVVLVVWPVYCLHWDGTSMERRKMDFPDCREACQPIVPRKTTASIGSETQCWARECWLTA